MYSIEKTDVFEKWLRKLKDQRAKANGKVVLLLNGGTKSSQQKDIDKAKDLWLNYKDKFEDGN